MNEYKTCTHTNDTGRGCKSAAATGREYCGYHLHYRGRLLRMARYRARHQRFDIILPPLDSLCSIHSALSQVAEALAADMIDPRRAQGLLKALRFAKENLKDSLKDDNAHWHDTPYHSEDATAYDSFEAEYGLPEDIDLTAPPEVAFPPPDVILSEERSDEPKDRFVSTRRVGVNVFAGIPMPTVAYCKHGPGCPEHTIRADYPETPELAELREIQATQGNDAVAERYKQQQRNHLRRQVVVGRKRYAAIALEKNMRLAAERLAAEKLAADPAAQAPPDPSEMKKPPSSIDKSSLEAAQITDEEAKSIA